MKALDLFCGAGGASMGLHRAGFDVTGVDIRPQPNYPFTFVQADALTYPLEGYDFIWASPPCQRYSPATMRWGASEDHPDHIEQVRRVLRSSGCAYVIENVPGAPLVDAVVLCGSMFDRRVRRHRLFEASFCIPQLRCRHEEQDEIVGVYGHTGGSSSRDGKRFHDLFDWYDAMGITWMTSKEIAQAIPPDYSEYIAKSFIEAP